MNSDTEPDFSLRHLFDQRYEPGQRKEPCPDPEQLWQAARGELPVEDRIQLVDHISTCTSCSEDWRLARALSQHETLSNSEAPPDPLPFILPSNTSPQKERRKSPFFLSGLAASVLVAFVIGRPLFHPADPGATRNGQGTKGTITSLVTPNISLDRDDFELEWDLEIENAAAATFDIEISTDSLDSIDKAIGLSATRYRISTQKLAHLPKGTRLRWRVSANLPKGARISSPTFDCFIE